MINYNGHRDKRMKLKIERKNDDENALYRM